MDLQRLFSFLVLACWGGLTWSQTAEPGGVWTPALRIDWAGERPAFVHRTYFANDPWSEPLEPPVDARSERFGFYVWSGSPLWLVIEVDGAPEGRRLCTRWLNPAGEQAAGSCQLLPVGPARLAFSGPDTSSWPENSYLVSLTLQSERGTINPLGEISYGVGEEPAMANAGEGNGGEDIPTFPWPPPEPTTLTVLERVMVADGVVSLGEVADRLTAALARAGYSERSFYAVPGGFALATRLEQIDFDGTPKPEPGRWSAGFPPREVFSLSDFVSALFMAPEGHYRVIVFVVNDRPFSASGEAVSSEEADAWLHGGLNLLPASIADLRFDQSHEVTALIYQYRKVGHQGRPVANPDGAAAAASQLERSGILAALASSLR